MFTYKSLSELQILKKNTRVQGFTLLCVVVALWRAPESPFACCKTPRLSYNITMCKKYFRVVFDTRVS